MSLEGRHGEVQALVVEFRDGSEFTSEIGPDVFSVIVDGGPEPIVLPEQLDDVCLK